MFLLLLHPRLDTSITNSIILGADWFDSFLRLPFFAYQIILFLSVKAYDAYQSPGPGVIYLIIIENLADIL